MKGKWIIHYTSVHPRDDVRVYERISRSMNQRFSGLFQLVVTDGRGDDLGGQVPIRDLGKMPSNRLLRIIRGWWLGIKIGILYRPRVIHIHDPELLPLLPFWKLLRIKTIYDVHEELGKQLLGKLWIPLKIRGVVASLVSSSELYLARFADAISAATPVIAENFSSSRVWTIQNYPSIKEGVHIGKSNREAGNAFFYVGGINKKRSMLEILDALEIVSRQRVARLTLAGRFSSESFKKEIEAHPAWHLVDYVGWADRGSVARYMSGSLCGLVLCYPERNFMEAQPTKLYEYMWGGLSIIASNFPYWRNSLSERNGLYFVSPTSAEEIATAMMSVLSDERRAKKDGQELKKFAMEKFSWESEEKDLFEMYKYVLGKSD